MTFRWRYSVGALLIFVAVIAGICGWLRYRAATQQRLAARIEAFEDYAAFCQREYQIKSALADAQALGSEDVDWYHAVSCEANARLAIEKGDSAAAISELTTAMQCVIKFTKLCEARHNARQDDFEMQRNFEQQRDAFELEFRVGSRLAELAPDAARQIYSQADAGAMKP